MSSTRIVVTGGDGFLGRNLRQRLSELGYRDVVNIEVRGDEADLRAAVRGAALVFHLAGVNRADNASAFEQGNQASVTRVANAIVAEGVQTALAIASSIHVLRNNPYGASKLAAEAEAIHYQHVTGAPVYIYRLPNVFGKWSRPNYNSVVATFCHNIARDLPVTVNDPHAPLTLVHVDDVIENFVSLLSRLDSGILYPEVTPVYETSVGALAAQIKAYHDGRDMNDALHVGAGLARALYSTYVSFLPEKLIS